MRTVDEVQRPEGYRLVGASRAPATALPPSPASASGTTWRGAASSTCDDLSTLPDARRRGHGRRLLDWLAEEGRRLGCDQLHLDSGVGLDRADAHRLYLNAGLVITSHHFARTLD